MNEAQTTSRLTDLLGRLGLWPYKIPDTSANHPQGGEPDIICMDIDVAIEVKMFDDPTGEWESANFPFRHLRADQRAYLEMFQRDGHHSYLALGTRHGTAGSKTRPRLLWLIPYREWIDIETRVKKYRKSLPLDYRPRLERPVRDRGLVATHLLHDYELVWDDGCWHLPPHSPFYEFTTVKEPDQERDLYQMREIWRQLKQQN